MIVKAKQEIYAGWSVDEAKDFCKENKFGKDLVKIIDRGGQIIVIARKEFLWE